MYTILALMGKSASGKDTISNQLSQVNGFHRVLGVSTRALRPGEVNGVDAWFVTEEEFNEMYEAGDIVDWTRLNGSIRSLSIKCMVEDKINVLITTPGGYNNIKKFVEFNVIPVYVSVPDSIRKERAFNRDANLTEEDWELRCAADDKLFEDLVMEDCIIINNY